MLRLRQEVSGSLRGNTLKTAQQKSGRVPWISGGPPLSKQAIGSNSEGESMYWLPGETIATGASYFLCRCGQSAKKPFCDGTHTKGFDGEEISIRGQSMAAVGQHQIPGGELCLPRKDTIVS